LINVDIDSIAVDRNICDESFALFPPTPDPELDEGYRK
jgi:hypothetical protein